MRVTIASGSRPAAAQISDACDTIKKNTEFRESILAADLERLAEFEKSGVDPNADDEGPLEDSDDPDDDDAGPSPEQIEQHILDEIHFDRDRLQEARQAEDQVCNPPDPYNPSKPDCDNIFSAEQGEPAPKCPAGGDVPIDPSGYVRTRRGVPLEHAKVVLQRANTAAGPFRAPPNGAAVMSADNRRNPDHTDIDGHFGWDVFPGYYRVRASRKGCHGTPVTKARPVPPPVTDLLLKLRCPGLKRTATHTRVTAKHRHGPSTVVTLRTRAAHRRVTGLVKLAVAGKARGFGFLGPHGRLKLTIAGHPRGRITARYTGNARFAPSTAHRRR